MKNRLAIDSVHWGRYFERHYIPIVNSFCDSFIKKVLPAFDNVPEEADKIAQEIYDNGLQIIALGAYEDNYEENFVPDLEKCDQEIKVEPMSRLGALYQIFINLSFATLYHMF